MPSIKKSLALHQKTATPLMSVMLPFIYVYYIATCIIHNKNVITQRTS